MSQCRNRQKTSRNVHGGIRLQVNVHSVKDTLIEIFCFYAMFIIFVRWRLSVGIKRFTYLLTYLLPSEYRT